MDYRFDILSLNNKGNILQTHFPFYLLKENVFVFELQQIYSHQSNKSLHH